MQCKRSGKWRGSRLFFGLFIMLSIPATCQSGLPNPQFASAPFEKWMAEGPSKQIPWKVMVWPERLSSHQRLLSYIEIFVPGKELIKRSGKGRLVALVQVTDSTGRVYQDDGALDLDPGHPATKDMDAFFAWGAFVLPGDYQVALALYDRETGEHNFTQRLMRIAPLKKDPLPEAWRDLPSVEFLERTEKFDSSYHPEIRGRLHLPLDSQRPLQIDLLVNLTPSEILTGSNRAFNFNLRALIPIVKAFSQIDVSNGVVNLATLDLTRQKVSFEQSNINSSQLDWAELRDVLTAADPSKIDIRSLQGRKYNAAFLRDEIARRIPSREENQSAVPMRVIILLSSSVAFSAREGLREIELPRECDCLVYHLRFDWWSSRLAAFDDIDKVLKPLKLRKFSASSAREVRKALAVMLEEISRAGATDLLQ